MHDEDLTRLRVLADSTRIVLDADARERVARKVGERGPGILRRAQRNRQLVRAGAVVVALAALAGLASLARTPPEEQALEAPLRAVDPRSVDDAPAAVATPAACAARGDGGKLASLDIANGEADGASGAGRVALGAAGTVVAEAGTAMWVDTRDPCRIRVRLLDGAVNVHADDLGGGELRVSTPSGEVRVHGTKFAVRHSSEGLVVDVDEGRVSVARQGQVLAASLIAGQRLRAQPSDAAAVVEALPAAARERLVRALAGAPAERAQAKAPDAARALRAAGSDPRSAQSLVDEAEALWRAGEEARARARYRQAGALSGPTAEAAWLALARRELGLGRVDAAQQALNDRATRFGKGSLDGEAAGIAFRVALRSGDAARMRQRAEVLVRDHAETPQGKSAAQWLRAHPSR